MKQYIDKNLLNPYIDLILNRVSFLYGINYTHILKDRMNSLRSLCVTDNMKPTWFMCVSNGGKTMEINNRYINYDSRTNKLIIDDKNSAAIGSVFVHELLHVASSRDDAIGIKYYNGVDCTGLNEGITQMFADDINNNIETKHFDGYFVLKTIAKMLRVTFGNQVICDSYFLGNQTLKSNINYYAGNEHYYNELNKRMTALATIYDLNSKNSKYNKRQISNYYNESARLLYKDVILNIIIPKLLTLNNNNKKEYLRKLITIVSEDGNVKNEIVSMLSEYMDMSLEELKNENRKLEYERRDNKVQGEFINLVTSDSNWMNHIMVRNDGSVILLGNPNKLIEEQESKEMVYLNIFENKYSKLMKPQYVEKLYQSIINGGKISVHNNSILERMVIFVGLRRYLSKRGIDILNDPRELTKTDTISNVLYINTSGLLSFEDSKKICKKYGIFYNVKNKNDYEIQVVDKKTGKIIDNSYVRKLALIANNWMQANGYKNDNDLSVEKAFNSRLKLYYDDLMQVLYNDYLDTGYTRKTFPFNKAVYSNTREIMKKFLSDPERCGWVYDYFELKSNPKYFQVCRGQSFGEYSDSHFLEKEARKIVDIIMK